MEQHAAIRRRRGAVVVALTAPVLLSLTLAGCSARDVLDPGPAPSTSTSPASSSTVPTADSTVASGFGSGPVDGSPGTDAWFRTALPVEGTVVGMVRASGTNGSPSPASGTVRITRDGDRAIRIVFTDLTVPTQTDSDLRVQLSASDVVIGADGTASVVRNGTAAGVAGGDPIEVGLLPLGTSATVLTFSTPQILPPSVHSLVILDYTHATVLAGAELVPAME